LRITEFGNHGTYGTYGIQEKKKESNHRTCGGKQGIKTGTAEKRYSRQTCGVEGGSPGELILHPASFLDYSPLSVLYSLFPTAHT
jgi:hypothetical protein